jgi:hypothetical protein
MTEFRQNKIGPLILRCCVDVEFDVRVPLFHLDQRSFQVRSHQSGHHIIDQKLGIVFNLLAVQNNLIQIGYQIKLFDLRPNVSLHRSIEV